MCDGGGGGGGGGMACPKCVCVRVYMCAYMFVCMCTGREVHKHDTLTIDWPRQICLQSFVFGVAVYLNESTILLFTKQFGVMPSLSFPEDFVATKST